jgi:acyl-coenzyme A synthetase/AMP-(fatty) acid ligase
MLEVGGENVAAAEIERVLTDHPLVGAAAVVGRHYRILDEVPVAFVVPGSGGRV